MKSLAKITLTSYANTYVTTQFKFPPTAHNLTTTKILKWTADEQETLHQNS